MAKRKDQNKIIENSVVVNNFLLLYNAKTTKWTYKSYLKTFFEFLDLEPDKYFENGRDYKTDVLKFNNKNKNESPHYQSGAMSCLRIFFEENDVELPNKFWKKIKSNMRHYKKRRGRKKLCCR